jgi:type II secretory pathway predicted ATPase ExeA
LHEVVAHNPEGIALRKDDGLLVDGAVLETKNEMAGYPIAMRHLCDLALGESFAFQRAQDKKAVYESFGMENCYWGLR